MHVRQRILETIKDILTPADRWRRVFLSTQPPARDVFPYLLVYDESESSENILIHPTPIQQREVAIAIRGYIQTQDSEQALKIRNEVATEIEEKLTHSALNAELSGSVKGLEYTGSFYEEVEDEEERISSTIALNFTVQIHTAEGSPELFV